MSKDNYRFDNTNDIEIAISEALVIGTTKLTSHESVLTHHTIEHTIYTTDQVFYTLSF